MLPMFSYYGSKYQMARKLTKPQRDHIIEPFAGSACYSLYYGDSIKTKVTLVDRDPILAGVWKYLIKATPAEIMRLPVDVVSLDEVKACQEAKWLIGFWFNCGTAQPSKRRSNWGREKRFWSGVNVWSEAVRLRIASQVPKIKHWKIIHGNWYDAPDVEAHWHVDPPYCGTKAGKAYKYHDVDYEALAKWCLSRKGFVQVCEANGADWLPFVPTFAKTRGTPGLSRANKASDNQIPQYSTEAVFEVGSRRGTLVEEDDFVEISDGNSNRNRAAKSDGRKAGTGEATGLSRKALPSRKRAAGQQVQQAKRRREGVVRAGGGGVQQ